MAQRGEEEEKKAFIWHYLVSQDSQGNDLLDEMIDDRSVHTGIYWSYLGCDDHAVQRDGGTECHSLTTSVAEPIQGNEFCRDFSPICD